MSVREADFEDIPALVDMGERFHAMSPHRGMGSYDRAAIERVLCFMAGSGASVLLTNGTGVIGATLSPVYFDPSRLLCEENFWWAERGGGELLEALYSWAKAKGASFLTMSTLENDRSQIIDRMMRRKGYVALERRYVKEIA